MHEVSIPEHMTAGLIFLPLLIEGSHHTLIDGDGFGAGRQDLYVTSLMDHLRGARSRLDELHDVVKGLVLAGAYVVERHGYRYYGKAMQLRRGLRAAYDRQLTDTDLLLLPTTPMKATPLPAGDASRELLSKRASQHSTNTFPFDITHHPAMSIPCGMSEGLPVGMMLVGRHWQEPTIYRTARAFEAAEDWRTL